jgi:hypothetical protein
MGLTSSEPVRYPKCAKHLILSFRTMLPNEDDDFEDSILDSGSDVQRSGKQRARPRPVTGGPRALATSGQIDQLALNAWRRFLPQQRAAENLPHGVSVELRSGALRAVPRVVLSSTNLELRPSHIPTTFNLVPCFGDSVLDASPKASRVWSCAGSSLLQFRSPYRRMSSRWCRTLASEGFRRQNLCVLFPVSSSCGIPRFDALQ